MIFKKISQMKLTYYLQQKRAMAQESGILELSQTNYIILFLPMKIFYIKFVILNWLQYQYLLIN